MPTTSSSKCFVSSNNFQSTDCIIVNEASSSKTAWFFYDANFNIIKINGKNKLSLSDPSDPSLYTADSYAASHNSKGYYDVMVQNTQVLISIDSSSCSKIYWTLLATGGMRNLEENVGDDDSESTMISDFYDGIRTNFNNNPQLCYSYSCKDVVLLRAQTIPGKQEGEYAWKTLQKTENVDCHSVIDLGGATGQFANQTYAYSGNIGKDSAIKAMQSASISDDVPDTTYSYGETASQNFYAYSISSCYNQISQATDYTNPYDGLLCRINIASYLTTLTKNHAYKMPTINSEQYCKLFTISNFYNYFNDICNTYLPYTTNNNLPINSYTLSLVQSLCSSKKASQPLIMGVGDFQNITDEFCAYWNTAWTGNLANYAKDACFSGNYNYQILRQFGLNNYTLLHILHLPTGTEGEEVYVDSADWALGAAVSSIEMCNENAASASGFTDNFYEAALATFAGVALAYLLAEI